VGGIIRAIKMHENLREPAMSNLRRTLLAIFAATLFSGCGQMGPLYIPAEEPQTAPAATIVPAETAPAEIPVESAPEESNNSVAEDGDA
jgi:predicted small lipoprotein YifL